MRGQKESCTLSEAIQNLPPELHEMILKEYIAIKIKEKKEMGWDKVHKHIPKPGWDKVNGIFQNCLSPNTGSGLYRWQFALNMQTAVSRDVVSLVTKVELFIKRL